MRHMPPYAFDLGDRAWLGRSRSGAAAITRIGDRSEKIECVPLGVLRRFGSHPDPIRRIRAQAADSDWAAGARAECLTTDNMDQSPTILGPVNMMTCRLNG